MFLTGTIGAVKRDPSDDWWFGDAGVNTSAGVAVNEERAMKVSAVFACVKVLAESVAQLPLILYERAGEGKNRAQNHPLFGILHTRPNYPQTSFEFREMLQGHLALRGNAYALIEWSGSGQVSALTPVHPDRVVVEILDSGRLRYRITQRETVSRAGQTDVHTAEEIFHLRGLSSDGICGLSPIAQARESVGAALAAEEYSARFFANDAKPRGVIEYPGKFRDEEAVRVFRRSYQESQTGENRHKTAVLEDGMKYHEVGMSNEDAQFLETRKFQVNDIARIFRVPPHMIGDLEKATFSNIEHQALEFVIHTIGPWLVRWEQAISRDLIRKPERFFAEHLVDGLLRGDIAARYGAYAVAVTNGWMTRNEVRKKENMNPLDGLDDPLTPMNMTKEVGSNQTERIARFEESELRAAFDPGHIGAFQKRAREIYSSLAVQIQQSLGLSETAAMTYCEAGRVVLKQSADIAATLDGWAEKRYVELANLEDLFHAV